MNKETLQKAIKNFIEKHRQYRFQDGGGLAVDKLFNHDCGKLGLFVLDFDKKTVVINRCLFNRYDYKKLKEFMTENHIENWQLKFTELGYPNWYFHSLSFSYAEKHPAKAPEYVA